MNTAVHSPIGIVGLGNMGLAIAERIAQSFPVLGLDLSAERRAEAQAAGITTTSDLADLTSQCTTVLMSLPHPSASLSVATALAADPGSVTTVLETSTVTPNDLLRTKRTFEGTQVVLLDAAILAGVAQMRGGSAGLVLAGDHDRIAEVKPVLDAITAKQTLLGESGTGMAAKVINNAVAHVVMVLLSEAVALSKTSGLDVQAIIDILAAPDGGLMRPLTHRMAERVLNGNYEGGMSLEAARKDSVLALQMATDSGLPAPTISSAHSIYEMAMAKGWAREDYASLAKLWEEWSGTSFVQHAPDADA